MNTNIGQNIKRLRRQKDMTQEQLAQLLCVSSAAISKWEVGNTYPDISMLFPLAQIFSVSIDELMGYDKESAKAEIDYLLQEARTARRNGLLEKAREILADARKKYPHDYRIMNTYMWDIAGGSADNDPIVLLDHKEEFLQICNCILEGCDDESIRLEAMYMKAKLLHAADETEEALKILEEFPTWFMTQGQKTEQLFSKDTPEFRYWNERNLYGLLDVVFSKIARYFWHDPALTEDEKILRMERLADSFAELSRTEGNEFLTAPAQMLYSMLAGRLYEDRLQDLLRVREKQFESMEALYEHTSKSAVLKELLQKTYGTDRPLEYQLHWLETSMWSGHVALRNHKEYNDLLARWQEKLT